MQRVVASIILIAMASPLFATVVDRDGAAKEQELKADYNQAANDPNATPLAAEHFIGCGGLVLTLIGLYFIFRNYSLDKAGPFKFRFSIVTRIRLIVGMAIFASAAYLGNEVIYELQKKKRMEAINDPPTQYLPLPHHVAKYENGVSFRFAMIHDLIHERYARHGDAYYRERERKARERLTMIPADSQEAFTLLDDIAVGLDQTGRSADAVEIIRDKLTRQQGRNHRDLYSSYANLGTFLIHAYLRDAISGNSMAIKHVEEGRSFLEKAIEVNPNVPFDRDQWQLRMVDFFLDSIKNPEKVAHKDIIGYELKNTDSGSSSVTDGNSNWRSFIHRATFDYPSSSMLNREMIRESILTLPLYVNRADPEAQRVPFDEPALAIVWLWRNGESANPHFAFALGRIMHRVGQRNIAWCCFERAQLLSVNSSFDPAFRQFCRDQQRKIEASLPEEARELLRSQFKSELAFGEAYQRAYQQYEEQQIQSGADINDGSFYRKFHKSNPSPATKPGHEEWYAFKRVGDRDKASEPIIAGCLAAGGIAMFLYGWIIRTFSKRTAIHFRHDDTFQV